MTRRSLMLLAALGGAVVEAGQPLADRITVRPSDSGAAWRIDATTSSSQKSQERVRAA